MANKIRIMREADEPKAPINFTQIYVDLCEKYRNVFGIELDGNVYFYRAIGRSEYREILQDPRFDDYKKEEIICSQCLLYPDPDTIEWDNMPAGVPTELEKAILKESFLDSVEHRRTLHEYYRAEMYDIDNQITCIINEAFPNIDIEEIERWDVEKTTKYLSRAEWKLHSLRGIEFGVAGGNDEHYRTDDMGMGDRPQVQKEEKARKKKKDDSGKTIRGGERASKLTPEKMKERAEFLKKFPQFANDSVMEMGGIDGLAQDDVDDRSPALRPGW